MKISLTAREVEMVLSACMEYREMMGDGEETHEYTEYMLDTGLGSAMRKIGKGWNAEVAFQAYKTVTKYPTFEEWQQLKAAKYPDDNE